MFHPGNAKIVQTIEINRFISLHEQIQGQKLHRHLNREKAYAKPFRR